MQARPSRVSAGPTLEKQYNQSNVAVQFRHSQTRQASCCSVARRTPFTGGDHRGLAPKLPSRSHRLGALDMGTVGDSLTRSPAAVKDDGNLQKIGVLFVCLGNICRSPSAEAVFRAVVEREGLAAAFDIDSCGTGGGNPDWFTEGGWSYHEGDPADSRMIMTARKRGVRLTSRSRPLQPPDLTRFHYVIGMDANNLKGIRAAADYWLVRPMGQGKVPPDYASRISLMTAYCSKFKGATEVPDPYYGGQAGFDRVLDLLEDASEGLLAAIRAERGL